MVITVTKVLVVTEGRGNGSNDQGGDGGIRLGYGIKERETGWLLYATAKFRQATRPLHCGRRDRPHRRLQRLWNWEKEVLLAASYHVLLLSA